MRHCRQSSTLQCLISRVSVVEIGDEVKQLSHIIKIHAAQKVLETAV
jgi:hypothetical protein